MPYYEYQEGQFEDYCPACERLTTHEVVENDELFEYVAECTHCHIIWEYGSDPIKEGSIKS